MKTTTFAVITLLILSFTSEAQNIKPKSIYAKRMTFELGGDMFFTSTSYNIPQSTITQTSSSATITIFSVNAGAGIFVIDGLKLGIEPVIEIEDYEGENKWTKIKVYFTPEYVFNAGSDFYFYTGASAGYTFSSGTGFVGSGPDMGGFSYGVKAGWKINPFGNCLFNFGAKYYRETYDYKISSGDVKQSYNIFGVTGGLSVFFK
jgi:hypothetical protein